MTEHKRFSQLILHITWAAAYAAAFFVVAAGAHAQSTRNTPAYPTKPIRLLVPFTPGGAQIAIAPAPARNAKLAYDPAKDFIHVMHLVDLPLVLIINPALPVANLKDFIAYAKANRGKLNTASTGRGTYTHLTIEFFNSITGAELMHIPYKGAAPALNDLMRRVYRRF